MRNVLKRLCDLTGIPRYWVTNNYDEIQMSFVRLYGWLPFQRMRIAKTLQSGDPINCIFGCGTTRYDGWLGIDCFFGPTVDLVLDLRRKIPLPNESAAFCYSEHFFEHLYPFEGERHLEEVHRILQTKGVYRIALPDGMKFVQRYLEGDDDFFTKAFPWAETPMDAVYSILNWEGRHRNILDLATLDRMGKAAGFEGATLSTVNASQHERLRIDIDNPQRVAETLYVELEKSS